MKIDLHRISVRKVFDGYKDSDEEGVVAYGGKLDIRPKYQREFVYKPEQRDAV
ncbi:MAG: HNH endonuclease, partial [Candidatus Magasanikbacteria bacterium]|nr:HNH endonuclease [Candidatus Magasanikbacteria bacterium]